MAARKSTALRAARQAKPMLDATTLEAIREVRAHGWRQRKEGARAQLRESHEYQLATQLLDELSHLRDRLADPSAARLVRADACRRVLNLATLARTRSPSPREAGRMRLEHFFHHLDGWAEAFACAKADSTDEDGREFNDDAHEPQAGEFAEAVIRDFSVLFPGEALDAGLIERAIVEWHVENASPDRSKNGGRRKGRLGKWNALAEAIGRTSFARSASSTEAAYKDWKKKRRAKAS
jgi:hypothetical protein